MFKSATDAIQILGFGHHQWMEDVGMKPINDVIKVLIIDKNPLKMTKALTFNWGVGSLSVLLF